jgi:hypothetical protein
MAHAKFTREPKTFVQTAYFTDNSTMNTWLEMNMIKPTEIKMVGTRSMVHYLVVYEKEVNHG